MSSRGGHVNVLQRLAEVDPGDDITEAAKAINEFQGTNEGLHAKTFVLDLAGLRSMIVTGSANLTGVNMGRQRRVRRGSDRANVRLRRRGRSERVPRGTRPRAVCSRSTPSAMRRRHRRRHRDLLRTRAFPPAARRRRSQSPHRPSLDDDRVEAHLDTHDPERSAGQHEDLARFAARRGPGQPLGAVAELDDRAHQRHAVHRRRDHCRRRGRRESPAAAS